MQCRNQVIPLARRSLDDGATPVTACMGAPPSLIGRHRETETLRRLLDDVHNGNSAVLVLRGESGVGKTALLDHVLDGASDVHVAQIAGTETEMELAYAGLHQLCGPMLHHLEKLPIPQREALRVAFGLREGKTPDQFALAMAVLSLLAESSAKHALLCLIDDVQWLDRASLQALSFVARRIWRTRSQWSSPSASQTGTASSLVCRN